MAGALTDWSRVDQSEGGPELSRTRIGVVGSADVASNTFLGRFGNSTIGTRPRLWGS